MFSDIEDHLAKNVCVIGTEKLEIRVEYMEYGETIVPIDETIFINYKPFKIVGMLKEYMTEEDRKKKRRQKRTRKIKNGALIGEA